MEKNFIVMLMVIAIGGAIFVYIDKHQAQNKVSTTINSDVSEQPERVRKTYPLKKPDNPEDYGMKVIDRLKPLEEEEIKTMVEQAWANAKHQFPEEKIKSVIDFIQEEQDVTQEKLDKIKTEVEKCAKILKENPLDEFCRSKTLNLTIIKHIGHTLTPDIQEFLKQNSPQGPEKPPAAEIPE